jgi:hypothetical protein
VLVLFMLVPLVIAGLLVWQTLTTLRTMPPAGNAWRACARCDYNLSGLALKAVCPECGSSAVIEPRPGAQGGDALASDSQVRALQIIVPLAVGALLGLAMWMLGDPWGWLLLPMYGVCCLPQVVVLPALARRLPRGTVLVLVLLLHGALLVMVLALASLVGLRGPPVHVLPGSSAQLAWWTVLVLPLVAGAVWVMAEYHSWSRWLAWKARVKTRP